MLDNRFRFPREEGATESDFDEFMAFCLRVNAEPILVVNTESWQIKQNLDDGAREAADWVQYCKDKGYKVKYWEIGNETYWHTVMTAKEYGSLVNVYAAAMKAEDPNLVLSVNGGWDINMTGNKERTDESLWSDIREGYLNLKSVDGYKTFKEETENLVAKPWTVGNDKWWHDLITTCGDNVDMISVHWYYNDNIIKHIDNKLIELKNYLKALKPEKDYFLCLSEYNCNTPEPAYRISGLAESLGRFLNSGTDIACFWPLRIGGNTSEKNNRSMLTLEDKNIQYPWQIINLFQKQLKGDMIKCTFPKDIYSFASYDGKNVSLVLSGRQLTSPRNISFKFGINDKDVTAVTYKADGKKAVIVPETADISKSDNTFFVDLQPQSFIVITTNN